MNSPVSDDVGLVPPAIDTLPINIAIVDGDGGIRWTNAAWREFGEANDIAIRPDTVGTNYLDVTTSADDETAQQAATGLEAVLSGETDEFELEYPCHSPDEKRWFLMRVGGFTSAGGRYAIVAHIDITDRVASERESELFERAVEAAGHAVFLTDRDGTITYVNPAFEEITGYTEEEAIGRTPRILKSGEHDREFYAEMWETILAGERWTGTIVNRRKSGDLFYVHASIDPVTTETGEVRQFVAIQTEITDVKAMQQQLRAHDDILRHDIRTQLNVILLNAQQIDDGSPESSEHVDAIIEAVDDLLGTTEKARELRQFLERTIEPEPIDVAEVAREVAAVQRGHFSAAEISVTAPERATALGVDALDRALAELVENSVTHSDRERPTVSIDVTERDDCVEIAVTDDGPGIHPMEYESLEQRVPDQLTHRSGIGLDLVYWIARRSGGRLHVENGESCGARVTVYLPRENGAPK